VKKLTFEKYETFLIKTLPLGKTPVWGQAMVIFPLGHGHITKNGRIPFFT
jgi:hypothetical protein